MTTENMGLTLVEEGTAYYTWADLLNDNIEIIDEHDHSYGKGVSISTSNILFQNNRSVSGTLSNVSTLNFSDLDDKSTLSNTFYTYGDDFYFNDSNGRKVQITVGNSINNPTLLGSSGIGGDYASYGADATYSSTTETYTFTDGSSTDSTISTVNLTIADFSSSLTSATFSVTDADIPIEPPALDFNLPVDATQPVDYVFKNTTFTVASDVVTTSVSSNYALYINGVYSPSKNPNTLISPWLYFSNTEATISDSNVVFFSDGGAMTGNFLGGIGGFRFPCIFPYNSNMDEILTLAKNCSPSSFESTLNQIYNPSYLLRITYTTHVFSPFVSPPTSVSFSVVNPESTNDQMSTLPMMDIEIDDGETDFEVYGSVYNLTLPGQSYDSVQTIYTPLILNFAY